MNSMEIYSLMARSLRGEASEEEDRHLTHLLNNHDALKKEFEFFRKALQHPLADNASHEGSANVDLRSKLTQVTNKLKDEGSL